MPGKFLISLYVICFLINAREREFSYSGTFDAFYGVSQLDETPFNQDNVFNLPKTLGGFELRNITDIKNGASLHFEGRLTTNLVKNINTIIIDQVYTSIPMGNLINIIMGRQRIGFGPAYLLTSVNNLDVLKNAYNPGKYSPGSDLIRLNFNLDQITKFPLSINGEILPKFQDGAKPSNAALGLQMYSLIKDIEFGFVGSVIDFEKEYADILVGSYMTIDIAGIIMGAEISGHANPSTNMEILSKREFRPRFTFTANRMLSAQSFAVLEYAYNGWGLSGNTMSEQIKIFKTRDSIGPEVWTSFPIGKIARNYLFASFSWESQNRISLAINSLVNLEMASGFLYPVISWNGIENVTLSIESIINVSGQKESEFSIGPYNRIGLVRAQYFF